MLTATTFHPADPAAPEAAALVSDYVTFDRRRSSRRPLIRAFVGFAVLAFLSGVLGSQPGREAEVAAAIFLAPALALLAVEALQWHRIERRLAELREKSNPFRKS